MVRMDSSGRVQPVEYRHMASPATCLLCSRIGRNSDELFANLGVELEFYGVAYLCQECCCEIADFVGFVSPEIYADLRGTVHEFSKENMELREKFIYVRGLLDDRINSVGTSVDNRDGVASLPLFEVEPDPSGTSKDLKLIKSVPSESGTK